MKKNNILANIDLLLAAVALCILVVVTFGGVIMRYFISKPIIWAEEVQLWCFLWMTFLGGSAAFRYGSHVAVEMVVNLMPKNLRRFVERLDYVITMLVLGYVAYLGCNMVQLMIKIGKVTSILHVPFSFINAIIPVCCILMMISLTYATFFNRQDKPEQAEPVQEKEE
ncbi:MAG: TRAP transporter small permease [Succinivibrio sp.]|nr:TRAP transporter small permease [Succinivibrio sp.]